MIVSATLAHRHRPRTSEKFRTLLLMFHTPRWYPLRIPDPGAQAPGLKQRERSRCPPGLRREVQHLQAWPARSSQGDRHGVLVLEVLSATPILQKHGTCGILSVPRCWSLHLTGSNRSLVVVSTAWVHLVGSPHQKDVKQLKIVNLDILQDQACSVVVSAARYPSGRGLPMRRYH